MNELIYEMSVLDKNFDNFMTFVEKYIDAEYEKYENSVNLKNVFEAAHDEDDIDPEMAELFKENEDQFNEGFLAKAVKAIKAMIEKFINWVKEKAAAVKAFFTKEETKETLDKAKKLAKDDPEFAKKEVAIVDVKAMSDEYDKKIAELEKLKVKVMSNRATEKEYQRFVALSNEIQEMKNKKVKKIIVPIAVAVGVIAGSATLIANKAKTEKITNTTETTDSPEDMKKHVTLTSEEIRAKTSGFGALTDAVEQNVQALKHSIKGEHKVDIDDVKDVIDPVEVGESSLDEETSTDMINRIMSEIEIEESSNFDSEAYLASIENELFN